MIPGQVIVTTLPPIPTAGLTLKDMDKLMSEIHELMSKTFKATSREVATLC